jgi:hypothetical protein|tara:strand:+ start:14688 stop:15206 length:519 start_codon:yes stop_codon:yes gene_type:complete
MMVKIAFYKGEGNIINRIVRRWSGSPYSHAELVMPDNKTWIGISPFLNSEVCARNVLKNPNLNLGDWDFLNFDITDEQVSIIMEFYEQTKGNRYDWIGMLLSQMVPFVIKQEKKWYCSEWIAYALRIAGVFDWRIIKIYDQYDLSPGTLYRLACEAQVYNESKKLSDDGANK